MRVFRDVEQGSDAWHGYRLGKPTASNFGLIMANFPKAFGEPAKRYASKLAVESITKKSIATYKNEYMEMGNELEPIAREMYEFKKMVDVKNGGFMEFDGKGASADGLIDDDGIIEIKSVIYSTHMQRWLTKEYDRSYVWQIQGNMWIYDRKYCDYVSYCPDFPEEKKLFIYRLEIDQEAVKVLDQRVNEFIELVNKYRKEIE